MKKTLSALAVLGIVSFIGMQGANAFDWSNLNPAYWGHCPKCEKKKPECKCKKEKNPCEQIKKCDPCEGKTGAAAPCNPCAKKANPCPQKAAPCDPCNREVTQPTPCDPCNKLQEMAK